MIQQIIKGIFTLIFLSISSIAFANVQGTWKSFDDATGKAKAIVKITRVNGEYLGTIESLINPSEPNPTCQNCIGDKKDKPIIGMTILSGIRDGANGNFTRGVILDPKNGKVYKAIIGLHSDGEKLNVRGYFGLPMLGRTQTWQRQK